MEPWRLLTYAGDSALLGPTVLGLALVLALRGSGRAAFWLVRAWLLAAIGIALLKILFLSCSLHWAPGLTSPSGHACMSMVAYGAIAAIFAHGRPAPAGRIAALLAGLLIAAIAVSRLLIGVHTAIEILVGLEVGALALLSFLLPYRALPHPPLDLRLPAAAMFVAAIAASGLHLNAEGFLRHLARRLGHVCVSSVRPDPLAGAAIATVRYDGSDGGWPSPTTPVRKAYSVAVSRSCS